MSASHDATERSIGAVERSPSAEIMKEETKEAQMGDQAGASEQSEGIPGLVASTSEGATGTGKSNIWEASGKDLEAEFKSPPRSQTWNTDTDTIREDPHTPTTPHSEPQSDLGSSPPINFILSKKGKYISTDQPKLKNSLILGVGFLELANAGDFAANVWNDLPVPRFATILMGLGGTFALFLSIFAFWDALLSRRNYKLLKTERHYISTEYVVLGSEQMDLETRTHLAVNFREMGTELIDRIGMDIMMGFGGIMVGAGTLLAIGGADRRVYHASNLMSGYVGNAPVASFGLINAAWSVYVTTRAHRHRKAGSRHLKGDDEIMALLKQRTRRVQTHATILGAVGVIAGAASIVTTTHWEGYPVLIPCILLSIYCNWQWRTRIGYDRTLIRQRTPICKARILEELKYIMSLQQIFEKTPPEEIMGELVTDSESLGSILGFLVTHDLFTDFCVRLLLDNELAKAVLGDLKNEVEVTTNIILAAHKSLFPRLARIADLTVREIGLGCFTYRQRYLLDALGCWLHAEDRYGAGTLNSQAAQVGTRNEKQ